MLALVRWMRVASMALDLMGDICGSMLDCSRNGCEGGLPVDLLSNICGGRLDCRRYGVKGGLLMALGCWCRGRACGGRLSKEVHSRYGTAG
jgi:hypothetical protein